MYINNHTYYSLRYGTMSVEELVQEAVGHKVDALALTDINNTMGTVDFVKLCKEKGIHPIAGIEFRDGDTHLYTGLARNNKGFRELNEFLSYHNETKTSLPLYNNGFEDVFVVYPFTNVPARQLKEHEYVGVKPHEIRKLVYSPCKVDRSKLVIHYPVSFMKSTDYLLHRHLRAIDHNILLTHLTPEQAAQPDEKMTGIDRLLLPYDQYPEIIRNTEQLVANCSIDFDFTTVKNKQTFTGSRYDDKILLEKLAYDGLKYRYGTDNKEALRRIRHELGIIDNLGFSAYFLITWDIIRYSMSRGFYHVGRGSGANSIVAYCLKITDVDPIELNLYFERFINPKRTSPPDFDIDYSWKDRDEVLDYIFKRYGKKHTSLIGTISTFRDRSIIRELGKVYGLPKEEIDALVKAPADKKLKDDISERIMQIGNLILDFPNIRSIHAGGVLISEEPVTSYTALDMPPKGMLTTQWDMYVADTLRFEKLDILSQRGIGHINESVDIISKNCGVAIDVHQVEKFKRDSKVNRRLINGETNGCFYIESPAMRGLLKKLRCDNYLGLVAASSIIRPGVAKSGMMKEYIQRFHNPTGFEYLHPVMEEQLLETYGVMVYQEDVLKICHHFAGLDLSDADILRRAMAGRFRSGREFERIRDKFYQNCKDRGYPDTLTKEVWRQVESFAGYAFSKAHSASYAVESYQSLYIKTYYPKEFMVAVINNFGGFYRTWVYVNEARRCGAIINLPCVNYSEHTSCIIGDNIYLGFVHIANLEHRYAEGIPLERKLNGPYRDMEDFIRRAGVTLEQLLILIRIDALRFTGKSKKELLWEAHMLLGHAKNKPADRELFPLATKKFALPKLEQTRVEDAYDEIELLGFPVTMLAFDLLETSFRGEIRAREMMHNVGRKVRMVGNLVTIKNVRTKNREWMHFGCFLDDEGEFFDTVNFPNTLKQYPFRGHGIYIVLGVITEEFGFPSMTVEKMAKLPIRKDPRY